MSENKKPTYIGLTIGPIFKTLGGARKTVELWAASYIFSHLMKKIVAAAINLRKQNPNYKATIINPLADSGRGEGKAGLYPDRLVLESFGDNDFELTLTLVKDEVEALGRRIAQCFDNSKEAEIIASVSRYLQTYLLELPKPPPPAKKVKEESPLIAINQHLDTAELQSVFKADDLEDKDYVQKFIIGLREGKNRKWLEKVFEISKPKIRSLVKIALHSLAADHSRWQKVEENSSEDEDAWMTEAKKVFGDDMKKHHSYVAIVHADGDNVGQTIQQLNATEGYQRFCKGLMEYGEKSIGEITAFGGLPIYAGGDDLLFFAPIQGWDGDHIFKLLERLDGIFSQKLKSQVEEINATLDAGNKIKLPTLSFGLSISYYKFPLYEALESSRYLLFRKAKRQKGKNAVALEVLLHSGHKLEHVFSLKNEGGSYTDPAYRHLQQLLGETLKKENLRLNSVTHALDKNRILLDIIGMDGPRMKEFFTNTFDEDVHKEKELEDFWQTVTDLLVSSYQTANDGKEKDASEEDTGRKRGKSPALKSAETVLRLLHFFNQKNDEQ